VQHKQFNFARAGTKLTLVTLLAFALSPAWAGAITQPSRPDPLLDSAPTAPCAAGVDYAAGTDSNGQAVVPADVAARPVPVPDAIAIPLRNAPPTDGRWGRSSAANPQAAGRDSTYVSLDGRKLEPLLNPTPCGAVH
jgi:hypothetical protein